jgi:hypothetical protein
MVLQAIVVDIRGQRLKLDVIQDLIADIYAEVVVAGYREAKAAGLWYAPSVSPPGPETVTVLAGDVG